MTVKCLSKEYQKTIVNQFQSGATIDALVIFWGRSRRTIIRVLEDHSVDPKIHRRPGRKSKATKLLEESPAHEASQSSTAFEDTQPQVFEPTFKDTVPQTFAAAVEHVMAEARVTHNQRTYTPIPVPWHIRIRDWFSKVLGNPSPYA